MEKVWPGRDPLGLSSEANGRLGSSARCIHGDCKMLMFGIYCARKRYLCIKVHILRRLLSCISALSRGVRSSAGIFHLSRKLYRHRELRRFFFFFCTSRERKSHRINNDPRHSAVPNSNRNVYKKRRQRVQHHASL